MVAGSSKNIEDHKVVEALLKELRVKSGLRQIDVASSMGVQQSMVSKYEVGERRLDILEIRSLCILFNIPFTDFVAELERRLEGKHEADR